MPRARSSIVLVETSMPRSNVTRVSATIVQERLAACATWHDIRSTYWWNNRRKSASEVMVSFKTTPSSSARLVRRLKQLHPYQVPYIAQLRVLIREQSYADWVRAEVQAARRAR